MNCGGLGKEELCFKVHCLMNDQKGSDAENLSKFGWAATEDEIATFVASHSTLDVCSLPSAEEWDRVVPRNWA